MEEMPIKLLTGSQHKVYVPDKHKTQQRQLAEKSEYLQHYGNLS